MPRNARSAALLDQADAAIIQEQGEGVPTFDDIIHGLGKVVAAGEFGALLAHVESASSVHERLAQHLAHGPAFIGSFAVDGPLDLEQGVDPAHGFDRNGREGDLFFARAFRRAFSSRSAMAKNGRLA